ncbi:MAG: glycosyltransferase family 4 protein [Methanobrevibacter sp.]|nr:glycosyltransferase family 4 protein [Methanobrevibacter sp.]
MEVTLVSRYFDTRNRGAGSYSKLIADGLNQKDIDLNLLSQENALISSYNPLSYLFFSSIDLKRLINKKQYQDSDVFHSLTPLESLYLPKSKSVCSILDFIPLSEANSFISKSFAKFFEKSIKSAIECKKIVVINPNLKDTLISDYGVDTSSVDVIPPPIEDKYFPKSKEDNKYDFHNDNDTLVIGTISNLMKRKRVDIIVKSFLKADIENSKLIIGGNGAEKENLIKLANGDERIEFLGFVCDEDMNDFYNSLDAFIFPSLVEGYGMPIIEAMACAKPVITLEDSYIPSNIKEKTFVCSVEDLPKVLENREFKCNIKGNIEFYKKHSIENISSRLMDIYESI